jgi:biotin operon repressor
MNNKPILIELPKSDRSKIQRCQHCLELSNLVCYSLTTKNQFCKNCVEERELTVLRLQEWQVYQKLQDLKHDPHYMQQAAQELGISHRDVMLAAIRLEYKGLKVRYERKFQVRAKSGELIGLSPKQGVVWETVMQEKMLMQYEYIALSAKELNWNAGGIKKQIAVMRDRGVEIPCATERVQNFKTYVLRKAQNTELNRYNFVRKIAHETGYSDFFVRGILNEIQETNDIHLCNGALWEEILKFLGQNHDKEFTSKDIQKQFPAYTIGSIRCAISTLIEKGFVHWRKQSRFLIIKAAQQVQNAAI